MTAPPMARARRKTGAREEIIHPSLHTGSPLACDSLPLIPAPGKDTYNVIFFVVVGNVLPQSPDDDHAENP